MIESSRNGKVLFPYVAGTCIPLMQGLEVAEPQVGMAYLGDAVRALGWGHMDTEKGPLQAK